MAKEPFTDSEFHAGCISFIVIAAIILLVFVYGLNYNMTGWLVFFSVFASLFIVNVFFAIIKAGKPDIISDVEYVDMPPATPDYEQIEYNKSKALSGFYDCAGICDEFVAFMLQAQKNKEFLKSLYQIPGITVIDKFKFGPFNTRLFTLVMYDVCKCYEMRGHNHGSEILCSLQLFYKAKSGNLDDGMKYEDADMNFSMLIQAGNDIMSSNKMLFGLMRRVGTEWLTESTTFLIVDIMQYYGYDSDQYIGLLDRLASHIEEVDKKFKNNVNLTSMPNPN
ncbi:MAG: hypothetical protein K2M31_02745 [Muribaculaceae bacterium]|nr:hypothetical protein [Muribaculaceae bacterium]